jgi:hypothetical protein
VQTCWKRAQEILQLWTAGDRVAAKLEKKPQKKNEKPLKTKKENIARKKKSRGTCSDEHKRSKSEKKTIKMT